MVNEQLAPFVGEDFAAYVIVESEVAREPADAEICELVRRNNGIENATVLFDPDGTLRRLGIDGRHHHRVLSEGAVLEFEQSFRDDGYLPVLQRLLP